MEQKTKHTPGPWAVEQCNAPVYGSDGSIIAEGIGIGTQSTHIGTVYGKNNVHNAHLIASAPAMYEALRILIALDPRCHRGVTHCGECGACLGQTALAQAEGK